MIQAIKEDLEQLKKSEPGHRFTSFYDFRQSRRRPGFSPARVVTVFVGLVLTIGGASIGWLPGPGGFVAIIGLAFIAQEFRPMAVMLDWCELKCWAVWHGMKRAWRRMSSGGRLALAMTLLITTATAGYAAYSLLVR